MKTLLEKIEPGDIVLTGKRGFALGSLPIRFANFISSGFKNRLLTHASLYIGDDYIIESIISPFKGVVKRRLSEIYLNGQYNIVVLRRKPHTKYNFSSVIKYGTSKENLTYDFKALIYFVLVEIIPTQLSFLVSNPIMDGLLNNANAYFCSELVAESLLVSGDYCFDRAPDKIKPLDFYNDYCFQVVKEDQINEGYWKNKLISTGYIIGILAWWLLLVLIVVAIIAILTISALFFSGRLKQKDSNLESENKSDIKTT